MGVDTSRGAISRISTQKHAFFMLAVYHDQSVVKFTILLYGRALKVAFQNVIFQGLAEISE